MHRYLLVTDADTSLVSLGELALHVKLCADLGLPIGRVYRVDEGGVTGMLVLHQGCDDLDTPVGQVALCEPDGGMVDALLYVSA